MSESRPARSSLAILVVLTLLGFWLRLLWLGVSPLRGDEAFTIQYWPASFADALKLVGTDPHPWGAYTLFANWRALFGDGEWIMRLLPALASLPGIAATYGLGRVLFNSRRAGWLAALLYAIHPFLIWHAQDVRNYAVWVAASALAGLAFAHAVARNRRSDWLRYGVLSAIAAYIFFLQPFMLAAQGLYLLFVRRDRLQSWLATMAGLGIALIPWFLELYTAATSGYGGTAGQAEPLKLVTWFLPELVAGGTLPAAVMAPLGIVLFLGLGAAIVRLRSTIHRDAVLFLVFSVVGPTLLVSLIATWMAVFRPRYVIAVVPFLIVLIAGVLAWLLMHGALRRRLAIGLLASLLVMQGWSLANYYTNPAYAKAPDWRTLGAFLTTHTSTQELVIQQALDPGFTYYFRGPAAETTLPLRANPPAEETITFLQDAAQRYSAIWFLPRTNPDWDAERVPLSWLTANWQQTASLTVAGFDVLQFRPWTVSPGELSGREPSQFGNSARLLGWRLTLLTPALAHLTLYWEPLPGGLTPLHGFAHLVGPPDPASGSPLRAQDDHPVTDRAWQPGVIRRDVYQLDLPQPLPGETWELHIGLYTPDTIDRLPVNGADHIVIPLDAADNP